jgi:hypothetical protein
MSPDILKNNWCSFQGHTTLIYIYIYTYICICICIYIYIYIYDGRDAELLIQGGAYGASVLSRATNCHFTSEQHISLISFSSTIIFLPNSAILTELKEDHRLILSRYSG